MGVSKHVGCGHSNAALRQPAGTGLEENPAQTTQGENGRRWEEEAASWTVGLTSQVHTPPTATSSRRSAFKGAVLPAPSHPEKKVEDCDACCCLQERC